MKDSTARWTGEVTLRWAIPGLMKTREFKCLFKGDGTLSESEVLESALTGICAKASSYAAPPNDVYVEVEFDPGRWGILGAHWRDGTFVRRSGILAIEAPDDRVSVQIMEEITDSGHAGEPGRVPCAHHLQ